MVTLGIAEEAGNHCHLRVLMDDAPREHPDRTSGLRVDAHRLDVLEFPRVDLGDSLSYRQRSIPCHLITSRIITTAWRALALQNSGRTNLQTVLDAPRPDANALVQHIWVHVTAW